MCFTQWITQVWTSLKSKHVATNTVWFSKFLLQLPQKVNLFLKKIFYQIPKKNNTNFS